MRPGPRLRELLLWWLGAAAIAAGQERTLHWRSLQVNARLESDGKLGVIERHAMVFTGDWNGGERIFRLFPGQRLSVTRVARIDPGGGPAREMTLGDLSEVDHYAWKDERTLRWRSRLPSDPPLNNTEIVTEIDYSLSGVLSRQGDLYLLDHDFAFPDRSGSIDVFSLDLDLAPAWRAEGDLAHHQERRNLTPGQSHVVRARLRYTGAGHPAGVRRGTSTAERWAIFLLLAAAIVGLCAAFRRREKDLGRLAPLPAADRIDARWLEENVFSLRPEEVGALWDESIGAPEVAALMARWTAEGKVRSLAQGKVMTLSRLTAIDKFEGYEKDLAAALFFSGREQVDTEAIREHYRSTGFSPADKIRPGLEERLETHGEFNDRTPAPSRKPTALLLLAGLGAVGASLALGMEEVPAVVGLAITHLILYGAGAPAAYIYRRRIDGMLLHALTFLWVPAALLVFSYLGIASGGRSSLLLSVGLLLVRIGMVNNFLNLARTRDGARKIARRKALAGARRFFERELSGRSPRLSDAWFPYVLAFGLGPSADRWARSFGAAGAGGSVTAAHSASGSSSSSSGSSGGWTGGGGNFGGAGASASWAAAAGGLAGGVSAPSSGGGGGGGGGGGSSGGGGGGGW